MDPKDQAGCGEMRTAHPVGPTKCPNNHHPCYGICIRRNSRCNFVLSVQNELLMAINAFPFSFFIPPFFGGGYFLWTVVILCEGWVKSTLVYLKLTMIYVNKLY